MRRIASIGILLPGHHTKYEEKTARMHKLAHAVAVHMKKRYSGCPTGSVQSQKMARGLKFQI